MMWDPTIPAESASLRGPVGPVMPLRTFPLSDQVGGECMDIHGGWSGPDVAGTPTVVAAVDLRARSTETDISSDCADDCEAWDSGYQREIIDGVTVYYGGDLCDSEESDLEDPDDVARREYVDQYNFDLLEGMEPMAFVPGGNPSRSDRRDEDGTYLYDGNDAHVSDDESIADRKRKTWRKYCASIFRMGVRKDDLFSVEDWADTEPHRPLCRMRTRIGLIRLYRVTWKCLCWHLTQMSFLRMNGQLESRDFL